ncbi:MAG: HEPN domain-containing protein [Chloroflexia bacterium]
MEQARADLEGAEALLAARSVHRECFVAQQVARKALQAFLYAQREKLVLGHSVEVLAARAAEYDPTFGGLREEIASLNGYDIPTRYPNGLPDSIPARVFGARNAEEALRIAREALDFVTARIVNPSQNPHQT